MNANRSLDVLLFVVTAALATNLAAQPVLEKLMITEVSWGEPDGVEITNFAPATLSLAGMRIVWNDGTAVTSQPLSGTLAPGRSVIVTEANPQSIPEAPMGTVILALLPVLNTTGQAFSVALRNSGGQILDEVRVSNMGGSNSLPGLGGTWRGVARRGLVPGSVCVERIWGLDSDSGLDWTEESVRSFGLENRSSGPRGTDTVLFPSVRISEIDDSPDYVEIYNPASTVNLQNWFFLYSAGQGLPLVRVNPFPGTQSLAPGAYLVIGNNATRPVETPTSVTYVNLAAVGGGSFAFTGDEYTCALYDGLGHLIDVVRAGGGNDTVVHNHPRAPSHWSDFTGAAIRLSGIGGGSLGRRTSAKTGSAWMPLFVRSMGLSNTEWVGTSGLGGSLDVRMNETAAGDGMTIIINGGTASDGSHYSFLFSAGHREGWGPVFGLGPDAIQNWLFVLALPPFSGTLDDRGSARVDLPPGSMPPGFQADCLFILQDGAGLLRDRTAILEFDT
jgi:hypothetical protein